MTVQELFDLLAFGELAQTQVGGNEGDVAIDSTRYRELIPAVNAALTALHTRFELQYGSLMLLTDDEVDTYELTLDHAASNVSSTSAYKYIRDTVEAPFKDNLLRVVKIYDPCGELVYINDPSHCCSVYCPTYNSIEFPDVEEGQLYRVVFAANHEKLTYTGSEVLNQVITLPPAYLKALLCYIAHRYFLNRSGLGGDKQSNDYYAKYENECRRLEALSKINHITRSQSTSIRDKGWV